jgi:hypothetical protein
MVVPPCSSAMGPQSVLGPPSQGLPWAQECSIPAATRLVGHARVAGRTGPEAGQHALGVCGLGLPDQGAKGQREYPPTTLVPYSEVIPQARGGPHSAHPDAGAQPHVVPGLKRWGN